MQQVWFYSLLSVFLISLLAFIGLFTFSIKEKKLKKIIVYFISIAAGALFGDVFIHILPEIANEEGFTLTISISFLAGVLIFFILEKIIHGQQYHQHSEDRQPKKEKKKQIKPVAYMSLIVSTIHNFLDGLVIVSAYLVSIPAGIGTTIAVGLHEIPHEVGSFSILLHGGFNRRKALFINFLSALAAVVGALVALWLSNIVGSLQMIIVPIAAGGLLYIAGSDLIPELHKEAHGFKSSFWQVVSFIVGIGAMLLLLFIG
ncbi:MAG: ZIP family metal transporter [Nanoarchaeota archaeon]